MKVLIIEDEPELAKSMVSYLSGQNYLCELAMDYHEAWDKIGAHHYDCILLDLMLPGGSGMKILDELKQQHKEDGVIIISAKNSLEDKFDWLADHFPFISWTNIIFCGEKIVNTDIMIDDRIKK